MLDIGNIKLYGHTIFTQGKESILINPCGNTDLLFWIDMADVQFTSVRKSSVSKEIAGQIKDLILKGRLKPGDRLPGERDLSKALGVGRLSLREALRILESLGILETRYGVESGSYVSELSPANLSGKFSEMLLFSNITIEQLTEARIEISLVNLKHFIRNAGPRELGKLEDCLKETEARYRAGLRTREQNILFHELIAEGSKNPIFIVLHDSLMHILRHFLSKFESPPDHSRKVLQNNKNILRYLKDKDVEKASSSMRDHVDYVGNRLKLLLEGQSS